MLGILGNTSSLVVERSTKYYICSFAANWLIKAFLAFNSVLIGQAFYPRIAYVKSCPRSAGFRAVEEIRDEKIDPIPIPAPVSPIAASPAPMYFAAADMIRNIICRLNLMLLHRLMKTLIKLWERLSF
jgi:hypothetical protein